MQNTPRPGHHPSRTRQPLSSALRIATLALAVNQAYAADSTTEARLDSVVVSAEQGGDAQAPTVGYRVRSSLGATKTDTAIKEIPQAVSVVTKQQIDTQKPRTVSEALRYTPGVFTGAVGATTRYDYIVLRGFSDHPTANEFLDGLRLFGDPDGYNTLQIDPYAVERLDIIRGPASVTYGQASPGGLVAISSKRPLDTPYHEISLSAGNREQRAAALDFSGPLDGRDDLSYRLLAKAAAADQQQNGASTERYLLAPSLNWKIGDRTSLLLQAYLQKDPDTGWHGALPYAGTVVPHNGKTIGTDFNDSSPTDGMSREQQFYGYQLAHDFGNGWSFQQKYRYQISKTDLSQYSQYGWVADNADALLRSYARAEERSTAHILDNSVQGSFATGALQHTLLAGVEYQRNENKGYNSYQYLATTLDTVNPVYDNSSSTVVPTYFNRQREQLGLYLQDQLALGNWRLTAGLRHDQADVSDTNPQTGNSSSWSGSKLTRRLGAVYLADNGLAPYASYSEGFDPSMAYATDSSGKVLKPLESKQTEVGLRYQPAGGNTLLSAAVYDLEQKNVAQYNNSTFKYDPIGVVRSRGIELEANTRLTARLSLLAGYTYTDMEVKEGSNAGKTPYLAPAHKASLWLDYALDNGLTLGGGSRYTSWLWADSANSAKVPEVTLFDVSVRYDLGRANSALKGATVQLTANNLADKTYVASCYSTYACYYGERRNVSATVNYKW
ncbi:TonB-dependent siderophore receptor [Vogesella indigofera]|uniref:TonB-dependent siderophore receptor n=1 Tax=Vogesella indigofera TaxID=45465 RepID=A0ABT5I1E7_VOGIN|nr:TonB-dependent siderophore receptor [Vogesella indigofera]MDC7689847.1 TonB-dependent siderophore receptor [Vogesella indigofera]